MALLLKLTQKLALGFLGFYDRYPRREARKDAEKAWNKMQITPETEEAIHAALDWQIPLWADREKRFIPLPATYLRGERWTDEPPTPPTPPKPKWKIAPPRSTMTAAQQTAEVIRLMKTEGLSRPDAIAKVFNETRGDS